MSAFRNVSLGCEGWQTPIALLQYVWGTLVYMGCPSKHLASLSRNFGLLDFVHCSLKPPPSSPSNSCSARAHKSVFKTMHCPNNPLPSQLQQGRQQDHQNHHKRHMLIHSDTCYKPVGCFLEVSNRRITWNS